MDRSRTSPTEHRVSMSIGGLIAGGVVLPGCGRERRESDVDAVARRAVHANAVLWRDQNDRLAGQAGSPGQSETSAETVAADGAGGHLCQTAAVGSSAGTSHLSIPAAGIDDREAGRVLGDRHHVHTITTRFCVPGGDHGLVQPLRVVLGSVHQHGMRVSASPTWIGH